MRSLPRQLAFLAFLAILCAAPLKFGLAEAGIAIPRPHGVGEWVFFSYPNSVAHIAIAVLATLLVVALVLGTVAWPPRAALGAAAGWGLLIAAMVVADAALQDYERQYGIPVQIALYGLWFLCATVVARGRTMREYAVVVLLLGGSIACLEAVRQFAIGLEDMRIYAAAQAGYADFAAFTNALLHGSPGADVILMVRKLSGQRVFGTFVYPNALGGFLIIMLPLACGLLMSSPKLVIKFLALVAFALGCAALLFSRSKASIAIAMAGLAALSVLGWRAGRLSRRACIGACAGAVLTAAAMLAWGYGEGLADRFAATGGARLDYWRAAVRMIAERPLRGWGTGGFTHLYPVMSRPGAEATRLAHNAFLTLWSDYGIGAAIGLAVALGVPLAVGWWRVLRRRAFDWLQCAALLAATGFTLHILVDFDFYVAGIALPALAALAMGTMQDT